MNSGAIFGLGTMPHKKGFGIVLYRPKTYKETKMGEIPHMYRPSMVLWKGKVHSPYSFDANYSKLKRIQDKTELSQKIPSRFHVNLPLSQPTTSARSIEFFAPL